MQKTATVIFQLFILLAIRLSYIGRVRVYRERLGIDGPVVVAANHRNGMDPFIIACFLPLRTVLRVMPYKFITANVHYYRWWRPLAAIAGCFPAHARWEGEDKSNYGVGAATASLRQGYSLVIFPEGKRTKRHIGAKPGISRILEQVNSPLVLCRIGWKHGRLNRVALSVSVAGKAVDRKNPDEIMKAVYGLPAENKGILIAKKV